VQPLPVVEIRPDTIVGAHEEFTLWAHGASRYEWSPAALLDDWASQTPRAQITENTTFSVIGYSELGCAAPPKEVTIEVNNELFVPTLFTPNGDNRNDRLLIYGTGIREAQLRIYSPWGKVVYSTDRVTDILIQGWDGTHLGKDQPEGSYIWELEGKYSDGRYWKKTGTTYLMR